MWYIFIAKSKYCQKLCHLKKKVAAVDDKKHIVFFNDMDKTLIELHAIMEIT